MKLKSAIFVAALACAAPAQAEMLRISGIYPAGSDEAAALRSIAVERFAGEDGARLSFLIEDGLRQANIGGAPWFAVLIPELAGEADAVLQGFAAPRFAETRYTEDREICTARDEDGACTETETVEARCIRLNASLRPTLRLVSNEGEVIWSSEPSRSQDFSYCPKYDETPQLDPTIDGWLEAIAGEVRYDFAPYADARDIRIMESRDGLPRPARDPFRAAIRLTQSDPAAACDAFASLLEANPGHPSLTFNAGLCAEQAGDFASADAHYRAASAFRDSDDEAAAGLARLARRARAEWQLANRRAG